MRVTFSHRTTGGYTARELGEDFGRVTVLHGALSDRVSIVEDAERGPVMRVSYPAGAVGPELGGAEFKVRLPEAGDEVHASYRVRFAPGFDFARGGKLPGLVGGSAPTGGQRATGLNGFSARLMWRPGGAVVQYVYHPDQLGVWGDDWPYALGGQRRFMPGRWHHVEHRVRLNTPGQRDGRLQAWFDGELSLDATGLRFRDVPEVRVDQLFVSTFFGGNDPSWAPRKDEYVDFDEFVASPCDAAV